MISFDIIFCLSVQKNMLQHVKNELIGAGDTGHRYRKSEGHVLHVACVFYAYGEGEQTICGGL